MCCCPLPSSSGRSPANGSVTKSPPRRRRACGWAVTRRSATTRAERTLVINSAEAETVRCIFALYRELGCVRRVKEEADRLGLITKRSMTAKGSERGGRSFSRGHIYHLLSNPIYIGEIAHKGQLYPGQHPALIDAETWTAVRDQLVPNATNHRRKADAATQSLLAAILNDARRKRVT